MPKNYPSTYEDFYTKLQTTTGISKNNLDVLILKLIKVMTNDLHRKGEVVVPYLGKFELKRMGARRRAVKNFATGERRMIQLPAEDKLKFTINKKYSKQFK